MELDESREEKQKVVCWKRTSNIATIEIILAKGKYDQSFQWRKVIKTDIRQNIPQNSAFERKQLFELIVILAVF